ncbi:hypothetical protein DFS34DRAFT_511821 [Phlyctochytrium arcticum]|nr:hypothetical protein DFS34DRAFT_511821 [Phlyctochytrium arcticum]
MVETLENDAECQQTRRRLLPALHMLAINKHDPTDNKGSEEVSLINTRQALRPAGPARSRTFLARNNEAAGTINLSYSAQGRDISSELREVAGSSKSTITNVYLQHCGLLNVPVDIQKFSQLTSLDVSYNSLPSFPPKTLSSLQNLTTFNAQANCLTSIPMELRLCSQLQQIRLFRNQITILDQDDVRHWQKLRILDLCGNRLKCLPEELCLSCPALEELLLTRNKMTELPSNIGRLSHLKVLSVDDNELKTLPVQLGQLENIVDLNASDNQLQDLPKDCLEGLKRMRRLFLSNNVISKLPSLAGLSSLRRIDLDGNPLAALPPEIATLDDLDVIVTETGPNSPLVYPPPDILCKDAAAIKAFMRATPSDRNTNSEFSISGLEHNKQLCAAESHHFDLHVAAANSHELNEILEADLDIQMRMSSSANGISTVQHLKSKRIASSCFRVFYDATIAGSRSLTVRHRGKQVLSEALTFVISPGPISFPNCFFHIKHPVPIQVGQLVQLSIQCRDRFNNQLVAVPDPAPFEITLSLCVSTASTPRNSPRFLWSIKLDTEANYNASFRTPVAGDYWLGVVAPTGEHIKNSPCRVRVNPSKVDPGACKLLFNPKAKTLPIGKTISLELAVYDAHDNKIVDSDGHFSVWLQQSNGSIAACGVHHEIDRHIISIHPTAVGPSLLHISHVDLESNARSICGSPFRMNVSSHNGNVISGAESENLKFSQSRISAGSKHDGQMPSVSRIPFREPAGNAKSREATHVVESPSCSSISKFHVES